MFTYKYPHPSLTADCVLLAFDGNAIRVLLIERKNNPYAGCWAFPGGFLEIDETIENTAKRELMEETGIICNSLNQFHVFSSVDRDERERVISVAFYALYSHLPLAKAADDAKQVKWFDVNDLPTLAFDHKEILLETLATARNKCHTEPIIFNLLPTSFTIENLKCVYEIITGKQYLMSEFSLFIEGFDFIEKIFGESNLLRFNEEKYNAYLNNLNIRIF